MWVRSFNRHNDSPIRRLPSPPKPRTPEYRDRLAARGLVDAGIEPRPARGGIPVWFGGHVEATLRRIGRIGDGWLPHIAPDSTAEAMVERMRAYALDAGRDPGDIGLQPRLTLATTPPDARIEYVNDWRALGATHFDIDALGLGSSSVDQHLAVLEETIGALAP
ncbi:LLM class flavin-dependent oxidoreductase [Nocardia sp. GP40]|uniref:LLM class flavin-dependent oxidoreductase n=1 Tax=Nocardia sp. GP40 TaxID=3156268 RepID=UPI003D1F1F3F